MIRCFVTSHGVSVQSVRDLSTKITRKVKTKFRSGPSARLVQRNREKRKYYNLKEIKNDFVHEKVKHVLGDFGRISTFFGKVGCTYYTLPKKFKIRRVPQNGTIQDFA